MQAMLVAISVTCMESCVNDQDMHAEIAPESVLGSPVRINKLIKLTYYGSHSGKT